MDLVEQQPDASIIERSIDDAAAFDAVFERHHDRVRRYVVSRIGPDAADDVVADTFVEAFRSRAGFDAGAGSDAAPWLLGIATNMLARHRAAERRWLERCASHPLEVGEAAFDELAVTRLDARARRGRIARAIGQLPARERVPLLLHVLGGCSYEEVARALDVPIGTVRSRISRGTARLRKELS